MARGIPCFFAYYGGKWRVAPHYPPPQHDVIVEPFAGAAGYSTRYWRKQVHLYDVDPIIVGLWQYLIKVKVEEVLALPFVADGEEVPAHLPQEARWLIGFWLNKGSTMPGKSPSAWMRNGKYRTQFWGPQIRARVAYSLPMIRHWKVEQRSFNDVEQREATWFVDSPYCNEAGMCYRFNAKTIDFSELGAWCRSRRGQVIVCEQVGATWLPFEPFRLIKSNPSLRGKTQSHEAIWLNEVSDAVQVEGSEPRVPSQVEGAPQSGDPKVSTRVAQRSARNGHAVRAGRKRAEAVSEVPREDERSATHDSAKTGERQTHEEVPKEEPHQGPRSTGGKQGNQGRHPSEAQGVLAMSWKAWPRI